MKYKYFISKEKSERHTTKQKQIIFDIEDLAFLR